MRRSFKVDIPLSYRKLFALARSFQPGSKEYKNEISYWRRVANGEIQPSGKRIDTIRTAIDTRFQGTARTKRPLFAKLDTVTRVSERARRSKENRRKRISEKRTEYERTVTLYQRDYTIVWGPRQREIPDEEYFVEQLAEEYFYYETSAEENRERSHTIDVCKSYWQGRLGRNVQRLGGLVVYVGGFQRQAGSYKTVVNLSRQERKRGDSPIQEVPFTRNHFLVLVFAAWRRT